MNQLLLKEYEMKRKMEDFAIKSGYLPYEPHLFEDYDNFSALSCDIKKEQLVTVINGQKFQLLRPDITSSIMNHVKTTVSEGEALKLFYQSTVYRAFEGDIKAINQFGIEYLGVINEACVMEVLEMAISYLQDVPFILEVGTTKIIEALLALCKMSPQEEKIFRKLIYIKNREELVKFGQLHDLPSSVQEILPQFFTIRGSYDEVLQRLDAFEIGAILKNAFTQDAAHLANLNQQVVFDVSMTSELTYYDGVLFKGYYQKAPQAVVSGGKYADDAIGFSIEVDSWLKAQKEEKATSSFFEEK